MKHTLKSNKKSAFANILLKTASNIKQKYINSKEIAKSRVSHNTRLY